MGAPRARDTHDTGTWDTTRTEQYRQVTTAGPFSLFLLDGGGGTHPRLAGSTERETTLRPPMDRPATGLSLLLAARPAAVSCEPMDACLPARPTNDVPPLARGMVWMDPPAYTSSGAGDHPPPSGPPRAL